MLEAGAAGLVGGLGIAIVVYLIYFFFMGAGKAITKVSDKIEDSKKSESDKPDSVKKKYNITPSSKPKMDLEKELQALKDLRNKDLITEENFNTKQKEILSSYEFGVKDK